LAEKHTNIKIVKNKTIGRTITTLRIGVISRHRDNNNNSNKRTYLYSAIGS